MDRINLKKLIDESNCADNTKTIQSLKHSVLIRDNIRTLERLKKDRDAPDFIEKCRTQCVFLYDNYTDIFNKVVKDEIDLLIMTKLLHILKMIEDDQVGQHEGSVMVGQLLKELYVDSAMKAADNLDKLHEPVKFIEAKPLSWNEFKKLNTPI